ncbi:hypothetical protein B0H14DRAFT_2606493 [Mycena olivaceomarginata]|nr:hypothetical protein B0H14DRAFT_2606493 [Mycena olivaceomarginata]
MYTPYPVTASTISIHLDFNVTWQQSTTVRVNAFRPGSEELAFVEDIDKLQLKILATYSRWMGTSARAVFADETPPSTACIVYMRKYHRLAPVITTGLPGPALRPPHPIPSAAIGSYRQYSAVSPNLSDWLKDKALNLQKQNLQNIVNGLQITGASLEQLHDFALHWGHCAETLALLYNPTGCPGQSFLVQRYGNTTSTASQEVPSGGLAMRVSAWYCSEDCKAKAWEASHYELCVQFHVGAYTYNDRALEYMCGKLGSWTSQPGEK